MKLGNGNKYCFLDFDGTLVDNKHRLYQFFVDHVSEKYKKILTLEEFWALKRLGVHEIEWLNEKYEVGIRKEEWDSTKKEEIENEKYLSHEKLFDFTHAVLKKLSSRYCLVLITRRSNKTGLYKELERFALRSYFADILICSHDGEGKQERIARHYMADVNDVFVGDTEDDILAGLSLGVRTFFVLSGIRCRWVVQKCGAESKVSVINDIRELALLIKR